MKLTHLALLVLFCISCKKNDTELVDTISRYTGFGDQTVSELWQASVAGSRYLSLGLVLGNGYVDIKKPGILVYNRNENHKPYLAAIEYAVPLNIPEPEPFTCNTHVWKGDLGFPLWLLHAWVWACNPGGIFSWINKSVNLR